MVKKFDKFAVFFILRSVYNNFIRVDCRGQTAPPRVWLDLAGRLPGPDGGGGGEVPRDGRGRHHLHHLPGQVCGSHSTAGQGQRGGPGCAGGEGHLLSLSQSIRESPYGPECWLISLTFSRANIRAQVKYFYTKFFSNPQSDLNRSQAGQSSEC